VALAVAASSAAAAAAPGARAGPIQARADPLQANHQVLSFRTVAINADDTKPLAAVNTDDKFHAELFGLMSLPHSLALPTFLSLTEMPSETAANRFHNSMRNKYMYDGVHAKLTYDRSQTLWSADWTPVITRGAIETEVSAQGKYIRTLLEHRQKGTRMALFTVHFPLKYVHKRILAQNMLGQAIRRLEDNKHNVDVDAYIVAGDFNTPPRKFGVMRQQLQGFNLSAQVKDGTATADSGRTNDNILFSDDITPTAADARVFHNLNLFTHYPVLAAGDIQF
jgi:hypothetical protein